jgi:hypothetical protein
MNGGRNKRLQSKDVSIENGLGGAREIFWYGLAIYREQYIFLYLENLPYITADIHAFWPHNHNKCGIVVAPSDQAAYG